MEVTPAQVVLRWHVQLGHVVIPKTVSAERMAENIDVFGFGADDLSSLTGLDHDGRTGARPEDIT